MEGPTLNHVALESKDSTAAPEHPKNSILTHACTMAKWVGGPRSGSVYIPSQMWGFKGMPSAPTQERIQPTLSPNLTLYKLATQVVWSWACVYSSGCPIYPLRFLGNWSWDRHPELCSLPEILLWFTALMSPAPLPNPKCSAPALMPGKESFQALKRLNNRRRGVSVWGRTLPKWTGQEMCTQHSLPLARVLIANILGKSHAYLSVPSIFSSIKWNNDAFQPVLPSSL